MKIFAFKLGTFWVFSSKRGKWCQKKGFMSDPGRNVPGAAPRAQDRTDDPNPALHFLHFSHHLLCSLHHYNGLFVRLTAWKRHKNGIKLRKWQNFKVCSAPCTIFFFWSALHPVKICSVFSSRYLVLPDALCISWPLVSS